MSVLKTVHRGMQPMCGTGFHDAANSSISGKLACCIINDVVVTNKALQVLIHCVYIINRCEQRQ